MITHRFPAGRIMDQYSEDDVKAALAPYHARIRKVICLGLSEWIAVSECRTKKGFQPVLYRRTITNYVFDAIARNARTEFGTDPTVRVIDEAQTVKFCFADVVVGRFKKGDDDHLGQNIATQAALDFIDPQQSLPGFPPEAAKVEFVWEPNEIGTEVAVVLVVARDGDSVLWSYEIDDVADSGVVVEFPTPAVEPDDEAPLVTPKTKPQDDVESE